MADNTTVDAGSGGDTIVTREISHGGDTSKLPGSFLMGISGTEGAYTAAAIDGDATNGLDVDVTRVGGTVTIAGAVTNAGTFAVQAAQSGTWTVDLGATDNAVLDAIAASLVTIDADTSALFGCVSGSEVQVDIVGALPAGTNAIGKLAANSGVDIGDVDVTSVPADPFGANADAASATGSISAKLRFIASTGIPITGTVTVGSHAVTNAGTFAVQAAQSGTWTVDLGATDNAVLDAIAASLAGTLTVGSHNVTNTGTFAVQATCTNAGVFAVQIDTAAVNSLALLDDIVFIDDGAFTPGTSKVAAVGMQADEGSTDSVDEGDIGCPRITLDRKQIVANYAHTAGGTTRYSAISTAAVLAAEIKGSAGQIYDVQIFNNGANEVFARLYNQTGAPGTGDTANIVWRGIVPGNAAGAGFAIGFPNGVACATGIGIRVSGAVADNDTTVLAANEVLVNVGYK